MNPELRFKDQQGNDFPDWEEKKIKDIVELNPKSTIPGIFEYVDLESVVGVKMVSHRTLTKENAPSRAQRLAQNGDLFFQTVRPYQKNNYLFDREEKNYVFSTGYAQMRPKVNGYFLLSAVQKDSFVNQVLDRCTGTSYPSINSSNLAKIPIVVPKNREEQEKIALVLKDIDQKIEAQSILVEKLRNTKESMLVKMFPQGDSKVPEIRFKSFSGDWEEKVLDSLILDLKSGLSRMLSGEDIGLPVVRANNTLNGKLNMENNVKYWYNKDPQGADTNLYLIHKNDILINFINSESKMGTAVIVKDEPNRNTIFTTNILRMKLTKECDEYFWLSHSFTKSYKLFIKSITKPAVNQSSFTSMDFKKYIFLLPSIKEQEKIGQFFANLDKEIEINQQKYEKLCDVKKALLHKLFPIKEHSCN